MADPTIVLASLSDDKLKESINSLVKHVNDKMEEMVESTNSAVKRMEDKLKSLGSPKIDSGGSADGGSSKRAKAQNAETDAVEKNVAARDKQIKKNQEAATSFDNFAKAQQVAIRSANPSGMRNAEELQTMNIQLDLLRERLREARQQYSSFVALAAHATTTGDKGLFQYATDGVHMYEQEVRNLIPQIRTLQSGIQQMGDVIAPQGHTIQNYVNSLQKANPELAALNAQYKSGTSLLQQQKTEFEQNAQAQRSSANATNQQKQTLDDMNAYIRQNIQREQERRDAIRQTGLAAQQSYRSLVQSAREQLEINTGEPIKGVKELGQAIIEMRRAYYDMSDAERLSPIGQSLFNDIKKAEELRKNLDAFNRNVTGISFRGANNTVDVDKSIGSYANLSKLLKELTSEYQKLGREERNAAKGNELADKIQRIGREAQKAQQQMNRPISFAAAMKGDEKTLDDIAYKMRRLQSYRQGIDLKKQNAANEIKQVDDALAKLQKEADKWMNKSQEMIKNNTALGRSWNYMKNRLAFYFTVGASTSFIKNLIEVRSQYEMNERALGILIDSAERGTQIFNELSQMALVSPYTLIELSTAAKQLTAYDIAAKDVVDTTRRLADMASAVGIPIERLTYALGQIKAYGYLNSRDARMFANAGIPLVKQLSDYYTQLEGRLVSTADVYDRIKKKTIDYEQVVQVINNMTDEGGKFFDFQAKMADTLKVRLANLTLAWNNMLNDIGSSNQGVLTSGIGALRDMFLHWKDIESVINKVTVAFGIYKTAQLVSLLWTGRITTAMGVQELVGKKLQARLASLTATQGGFLSAATTGWAALAFVAADVFLTISRNAEEIERLNKTIADGAKESYESLDKMLHSSEMVSTRLSALQGKLSDTDAAKAWEMLREQIELSSASSKELIAELMKQPDLNKRVTESFNLAEKIEEANRKLSDLSDNLDVTQNSILFGLFGEGLAEDIDDYNERIKYTAEVAEWSAKKNKGFWENAAMGLSAIFNEVKDAFGSDSEEAQNEIKNFSKKAAQTIKDELGEEGIKDKIQVNEAIARVVRGMEQQFPQIRGKGKVLFETIFYDTMATEFRGAVDSQAYYYEKFLEQLKKDHASAFSGVTEDINKETFKWSSAQIDAIQKTADKVKKDLPAASQVAIDEILRQLNSTDFKVRIVAEMATTSLDNVQKQFREKFIEKPWIANDKEREKEENEANQRYGTLMRKNTESNVEYEKRISDEKKTQLELSQKNADIISKNQGKEDKYSKAVLADAQKQKEIADDRLKAINEIEDKGGYDFSTKGEKSAARKAAKQAESELAKALKDELSTIDKVRSIYKDLTKEGMSHANAVERATRGWDETVNAINKVLQKNGLQKLDLSKFAGIENPRELLNILQSQLETLVKRGASTSEIRVLQTKIQTVSVEADKYDLTMITKGLNNELGKLKDEYELAVELDANPEMGNMFADFMGINVDELPRTFQEAARRAQKGIDKVFAENNRTDKIDIASMLDKESFDKWVKDSGLAIDSELVKAVEQFRQYLHKTQVDENKKMTDGWSKLVEKYGDLQAKMLKIYKDSVQEQIGIVRKFGDSGEVQESLDLSKKINLSQDPAEIARLQEQLADIIKSVVARNPQALDIATAIENKGKSETAKATWEDFKNSELYTMTFEDMANNSTRAIQTIVDKLNELKDKVKEDPVSMKALMKALDDAESELRSRNPFAYAILSLKEWKRASDGVVLAQKNLEHANIDVALAQKQVDKEGTPEQQALARKVLASAINKQKEALEELTKAENRAKKSKNNLGDSVGKVAEAFDEVSKLVNKAGDIVDFFGNPNEYNEISESIHDIASSIEGMSTASKGIENLLKADSFAGYVSAATTIASGLFDTVSSWFDNSDKEILQQIKDSEKEVKKLENSYKDLEYAIEQAYGMAEYGARRAAIANRQLQLVELQRQLILEQSRDSKHRDEDRILELKGQIIDLRNEIAQSIDDITNDLLGISSVGNAAEELVSSMIDAFKQGEDYMLQYDESFEKMIDNMIMKAIVSRVVGDRIEQMWNQVKAVSESRGNADRKRIDELTKQLSEAQDRQMDLESSIGNGGNESLFYKIYGASAEEMLKLAKSDVERIKAELAKAEKDYAKAIEPTKEDVDNMREMAAGWRDDVKNEFEYWMGAFGIGFGEGADNKQLSSLQQGISGITEQQAGALEAYWNSNTQQQFLHSDLLTQIRDTMVGWDFDVQTATMGEILLQLRSSYEVQMAIHGILEGVLNPSGRAFNVELLS